MDVKELDVVIYGMNGNSKTDQIYYELQKKLFDGKIQAGYKHLSGESFSSTIFALWIAAKMVKKQEVPAILQLKPADKRPLRNILIYNHWQETNHSLFLISQC